ncbi:unnamed protein product [Adineta ricciae]|uniref:Uncharacterized protein n=1 Tax=Adineta ricciae TaxID=249248 RepID=A0A815EM73_ADIRI|nr:unnamed protein product [Adineta ricciae]
MTTVKTKFMLYAFLIIIRCYAYISCHSSGLCPSIQSGYGIDSTAYDKRRDVDYILEDFGQFDRQEEQQQQQSLSINSIHSIRISTSIRFQSPIFQYPGRTIPYSDPIGSNTEFYQILQESDQILSDGRIRFRRFQQVLADSLPSDSSRNWAGNIRSVPDRFQLEVCRKWSENEPNQPEPTVP